MIEGWDAPALLDEVLGPPCRAYLPLPDLRVIERPGWHQLITPSFKQGSMNGVSLSLLEPSQADAIIDTTIEQYRQLDIPFRWNVLPHSTPTDLGERLARRGLTCSWTVGVAGSTSLPIEASDDPIHVEAVGLDRVEVFSDVVADGWECDREPFAALNRMAVAHPAYGQHLFIASYDGKPAAAAMYMAFARSAYLIGGVVLPEFRGKGVYRALVAARLRDAAARGLSLATSHAMADTSAPLLLRMGFVEVCRYAVYRG
jgi:GNAT superfamily N-acetyltransferase